MKKVFVILFSILVSALLLAPLGASASDPHEHTLAEDSSYTELANSQHSFLCECGEEVIVSCTFSTHCYYDDLEHWYECNYCYNFIERAAHEMDGCECIASDCSYSTHVLSECTPCEDNQHEGTCTVCHESMVEYHDYQWQYDEEMHWSECMCGSIDENSREAHELSQYYVYSDVWHSRYCGCGYLELREHIDLDGDFYCDTEDCGVKLCLDFDGDHLCDDCGVADNKFCADTNLDHVCDGCGGSFSSACTDENGDHVCDVATCARLMIELCVDEDYDYICDECARNNCSHYDSNCKSNGDGTHTGECYQCGADISGECDNEYGGYCSYEGHGMYCYCGYEFPADAHTYLYKLCATHSLSGHFIACDVCLYEHYEAHTAESGTCDVCGETLTELFDLYVGDVGLKDGFYLSNAGKTSETKPDGGYAYYHEGVLELNGFSYTGKGALWQSVADAYQSRAALFFVKDVTLRLVGENFLSCTFGADESDGNGSDISLYGDGIAAVSKLTIVGDGSLTILSTDDGVNIKEGDLIVESGSLTIGQLVYNESDLVNYKKGAGDDGIDIDDGGSLLINGGSIQIVSRDKGLDISGTTTVNGATLTIFAGDDGIDSNAGILIGAATVTVYAEDEDMTSSGGSIHIQTAPKEETAPPMEDTPVGGEAPTEQPSTEQSSTEQPSTEQSSTEQPTADQSTAETTPSLNENSPSTAEKDGFSLTTVILIATGASLVAGFAAFLIAYFIYNARRKSK